MSTGRIPTAPARDAAVARPDTYNALVAGQSLAVSDPAKGVIANDTNVYGVTLLAAPANGTVNLARNGTFTYTPSGTATADSFTYCANGTVTAGVCSSGITATVTLGASNVVDAGIACSAQTFNANVATYLSVKTPGVLAGCTDGANLPLKVVSSSVVAPTGLTVVADANGGFTASLATPCATATGCAYTFTFQAQNSLGTLGAAGNATVVFPKGSGLKVTVLDGSDKMTVITDYRWIIEEDRTFYIDPTKVDQYRRHIASSRRSGVQLPLQLHAVRGPGVHRNVVLRRRTDGDCNRCHHFGRLGHLGRHGLRRRQRIDLQRWRRYGRGGDCGDR